MQEALGFIAFCFACGCAVFWFMAAINMFRMVRHRKPGVPLFPNWFESPFNIVFRPLDLTDVGLKARRKVLIGFCGFLACWAVAFAAATLAKVLD
jgi:hypothetical protein